MARVVDSGAVPVPVPKEKLDHILGEVSEHFEEAVEQVQLLTPQRDNLTVSQHQRFEIYLENLRSVRKTLLQMIDVYLDDEDLSLNLLNLLEVINHVMPPENEESDEEKQEEERKMEKSEDLEDLADYRNAIALNQLIDGIDATNGELHQKLDAEYQNERIQKLPQNIKKEAGVHRRRRNSFDKVLLECYKNRQNKFAQQLEKEEARKKVFDLEENKFEVNAMLSGCADEQESLTVKGIFTPTQCVLQTWKASPRAVIEYVEVKITKKFRSYKQPFVLALWEEHEDLEFEVSPQLLSSLTPFGFVVFRKSGKSQSICGNEPLLEGDTLGFGMIPLYDTIYLFFGTRNGKWIGHFEQDTSIVPTPSPYTIRHRFRLILLSGSAFQAKQLDVEVNRENFSFDLQLSLEECSICYSEVIEHCMQVISKCGHRFCRDCVTGYLENALGDGRVIDTKCPDMNCEILLDDEDIKAALSTLSYGKFQQFRILAHMRLDPNIRWCPTENCPGGVVSDPSDPLFPKLVCNECGISFCAECSLVWHEGFSCQSYRRHLKNKEKGDVKRKRKQEQKDMKEWLKQNKSIKCAKCGALVQRESGCNHITCRCGYEFCWLCGESIYVSIEETPLHYLSGACAGLQMSSKNELTKTRKRIRTVIAPVRFGITLPAVAVGSISRSIKERRNKKLSEERQETFVLGKEMSMDDSCELRTFHYSSESDSSESY